MKPKRQFDYGKAAPEIVRGPKSSPYSVVAIPVDETGIQEVSSRALKALERHPEFGQHAMVTKMLAEGDPPTYGQMIRFVSGNEDKDGRLRRNPKAEKHAHTLARAIEYAAEHQLHPVKRVMNRGKFLNGVRDSLSINLHYVSDARIIG